MGEARRCCCVAHVGREDEEDASCEEVLLVFAEAAPRPRLPGLGGARHATIEEGGCCRAVDAAGHRYSPEVAPSGLAKGLRAWRGFVAECTALERKFGDVVRALRAGLRRWVAGRLKASFQRWHATVAFFDESGKVRPAHVAPAPRAGLPDVGVSSGPRHKARKGHPQGPAVEEALDQAHAA